MVHLPRCVLLPGLQPSHGSPEGVSRCIPDVCVRLPVPVPGLSRPAAKNRSSALRHRCAAACSRYQCASRSMIPPPRPGSRSRTRASPVAHSGRARDQPPTRAPPRGAPFTNELFLMTNFDIYSPLCLVPFIKQLSVEFACSLKTFRIQI